MDRMLPWATFKFGPWDIVQCLSGPFWPIARKSGRSTGQAALPIPTPLGKRMVHHSSSCNTCCRLVGIWGIPTTLELLTVRCYTLGPWTLLQKTEGGGGGG